MLKAIKESILNEQGKNQEWEGWGRETVKQVITTHKEEISELEELKILTHKAAQRYKAILWRFILIKDQKQNGS